MTGVGEEGWEESQESPHVAPGGSGLHRSGHFLEVRGDRSVRTCAEMERGEEQNQAMERVKRCVCAHVCARVRI